MHSWPLFLKLQEAITITNMKQHFLFLWTRPFYIDFVFQMF